MMPKKNLGMYPPCSQARVFEDAVLSHYYQIHINKLPNPEAHTNTKPGELLDSGKLHDFNSEVQIGAVWSYVIYAIFKQA
jgi:hypothetical protein